MQVASSATIRPDLADGVREHDFGLDDQFMGLEIFPIIETLYQAGSFGKLPIENVTDGSQSLVRAPGSGYARQQSELETDTYACVEYGPEESVDDGEAKRIGIYFDAELEAANYCRLRLRRAQEARIAALAFDASGFASQTADVTTEWNTAATATPFADVNDIILTLKQNVGGAINGEICLAVSEKVFRNMYQTAEIKALRAGGAGSMINQLIPSGAEMAAILGIDRVVYSSAQDAGADIWSDEYALLFIRSKSNMLKSSVQLGRSFLWVEDCPLNAFVESYRDEVVRSNIIRVRQYIDEKIFNYAAGYLLGNITT